MPPGNANCMPMKWKFHKHAIRIPCLWNRICISISFSEEKKETISIPPDGTVPLPPQRLRPICPKSRGRIVSLYPHASLKKETLYNYEGFSAYSPALCAPL